MVVVCPAPGLLDTRDLSLYYVKDTLLCNLPVIVFYGPSKTTNATLNTSRIQAHVYTLGGFQSFPRLTISPNSPIYAAVHHLPDGKQGEEIYRGLAVSLLKYFAELPKAVKTTLSEVAALGRPDGLAPAMFDEMHAADLASEMVKLDNVQEIANHVMSALSEKSVSWIDVDLILPASSIQRLEINAPDMDSAPLDGSTSLVDYGRYSSLIPIFGSPTFLPTSKLRRAPSRPTAVSKARILDRVQKESLRREMCELLDTEESYVQKISDLLNSPAAGHARSAINKPYPSISRSERAIQRLFPESLSRILKLNTDFMHRIQEVIEQTETEAIIDIQSTAEADMQPASRSRSRPEDHTGTDILAKNLLDWFPKFTESYQDYLRASVDFSKTLTELLRDSTSQFSAQVFATGEQRLRSWLIEPVQRLPRYSLFIDNMVNLLPATHPAMSKFLKARDMIATICALDNDPQAEETLAASRLRELVAAWPASLSPKGRLITVVDVYELKAPYKTDVLGRDAKPSLLLLFRDTVVVVRKSNSNSLSARGVLAEIERPMSRMSLDTGDGSTKPEKELAFAFSFELLDTQFTEFREGQLIAMTCTHRSANLGTRKTVASRRYHVITKVFKLDGAYEGRATRWNEEVTRARVEYRFPEPLRDSGKWAILSTAPSLETLGILTAVYERNGTEEAKCSVVHEGVQVFVDQQREGRRRSLEGRAMDATAYITTLQQGSYSLDCEGPSGFNSTDKVTEGDLAAVFSKRLGNMLRIYNQPQELDRAHAHISYNQKVLETVPLPPTPLEESHSRQFRPLSPIKAISSFLGGSMKATVNPSREPAYGLSVFDKNVVLQPPKETQSKPNGQRISSDPPYLDKSTLIGITTKDSIGHLEDTFNAYVLALRFRSGDMVGRYMRNRANADELMVNELYNILVEDPSRIVSATYSAIDVLFAAFEKFLSKAWAERMGTLLTPKILRSMQSVMELSNANQAAEQLHTLLGEMTPQNQRAFTTLIKLLSDLLEASGSDGDRGALTAAFAEILIPETNPHNYIPLLDRLVEDYDVLLDGYTPLNSVEVESVKRSRSVNTGSLSSNASSLRKRFGFGNLTRENSRTENESKVGSVWRTLSKNKTPGDGDFQPGGSVSSKSFLVRSRSTDQDNRKLPPSRPGSSDRPPSSRTDSREGSPTRPGSAHNMLSGLSTIGEGAPEPAASFHPRKKRRSSLSDLQSLPNPNRTGFSSTIDLRKVNLPLSSTQNAVASPRTPSPVKRTQLPIAKDSPPRFRLPVKKENSPVAAASHSPHKSVSRPEEVVISSFSPQKRKDIQSYIPPIKPGLQEQRSPGNSSNVSPKKSVLPISSKLPPPTPQKLRIQSPQKLRERLEYEQKAIKIARGTFQAELSNLGADITAQKENQKQLRTSQPDLDSVLKRVAALESQVTITLTDLTNRTTSIISDLESSLLVSTRKAASLDQLYREANAENEALYERFNEELGKVLKGVRGGQGVEETRGKMREAQDEVLRLKGENGRLKRENLGLKAQLRGDVPH